MRESITFTGNPMHFAFGRILGTMVAGSESKKLSTNHRLDFAKRLLTN
jgi:hypothetical protein